METLSTLSSQCFLRNTKPWDSDCGQAGHSGKFSGFSGGKRQSPALEEQESQKWGIHEPQAGRAAQATNSSWGRSVKGNCKIPFLNLKLIPFFFLNVKGWSRAGNDPSQDQGETLQNFQQPKGEIPPEPLTPRPWCTIFPISLLIFCRKLNRIPKYQRLPLS